MKAKKIDQSFGFCNQSSHHYHQHVKRKLLTTWLLERQFCSVEEYIKKELWMTDSCKFYWLSSLYIVSILSNFDPLLCLCILYFDATIYLYDYVNKEIVYSELRTHVVNNLIISIGLIYNDWAITWKKRHISTKFGYDF